MIDYGGSILEWMIETENECLGSTAVLYSPSYTAGALGNTVQTWQMQVQLTVMSGLLIILNNPQVIKKLLKLIYISVPYNTDVNVEIG
jgi:hypothetical protein